jgi:hypothetical protein
MRGLLLLYSLIWSLLLAVTGFSPVVDNGLLLVLGGGLMSLHFSFQLLKHLALSSKKPIEGELVDPEAELLPINLNQQHVHYHFHNAKKQAKAEQSDPLPALAPTRQGVSDLDRRAFLKLIGSAGMAVFLLQLFSGKANAAFFGSVPGPGTVGIKDSGGNLIDPAISQPTDGYKISQIDDASATVQYFGFVNKDGAWYIQKEDSSEGTYRYTKGSSNFATNWTNRTSLTYDYFDSVF